ncbi:ABC transporter permease [Camelimonas lactis]|uniref:Putative ABC transport system permease protein n=1 Tax=Camelimonas lactis TaxID=659006 RepID=A0A4R2GUW6_9HYPH|nr:FtsX-like permease family protein [Camelimonas lactis]TCO14597.1 putative ABC transport system permease protein [Camelimonas lactis]
MSDRAMSGRRAILPLTLRLALRELRGGLRGFGVFLGCIILGVAAIAGVSSISRSLTEGLAREGRAILGGDLAISFVQREPDARETAYIKKLGANAVTANLRAMARVDGPGGDAGSAAMVELKAIEDPYPLVGKLELEPALPLDDALAVRDGAPGAVAEPALFARLGVKVGDRILIGDRPVELRARLVSEPDKLGGGYGFGPRLMVSTQTLRESGLIQPGSLVRWTRQVALPAGANDDAALKAVQARLETDWGKAGWQVRSRQAAAPEFERNIERFTQFLSLVGLTALLVGGVGVANATRGFVDRQRRSIATMKSLGASGSRVVAIYLTQVMLVALAGVIIGLMVGAVAPFAAVALAGDLLPVPIIPTLAWRELALAAVYGLLTAFVFAIGPLGRARDVPVSGLFRDMADADRRWPRPAYLLAMAAGLAILVTVAIGFSYDRRIAIAFVVAAFLTFLMLRLVAMGVMAVARRLPRPRHAPARLALANIHRAGALTPSLVLSVGLGVTLLVALALVQTNIRDQLTRSVPGTAPDFYFVDIPSAQADAFAAMIDRLAPGGRFERVPMMRGRIVSINGAPAEKINAPQDVAWVLDGDRGVTFSEKPPEGSRIASGAWWPADYSGPPLVSLDQRIAKGLGLEVGGELVVNVLGREIRARVASLRAIEWRSLGINFVMIFSPNTFRGAPHTALATLRMAPDAPPGAADPVVREAAKAFPMVASLRVREALNAIDEIVGKLSWAIAGASLISLAASVLVLAGALAAGQRARLYDAVILKTLGATRGRLLLAYALEYGGLAVVTGAFGLAAGAAAGWFIVTRPMRLEFLFSWPEPLMAIVIAIVVTVALGLAGTWRVLGQSPAQRLRAN